ncbi:MAG: hypothetical protein Q7W02_24035 [Candidatus Rokubacteria bacterium]|nr:hypothetical protein [Candidatus Rokubacteria bacterium]
MFSRLYFETSELVATGWPRLSADLENVLGIMASLKIPVFFPAGVEIELEERWRRGLAERLSDVRSKARAAEAHFGGVQEIRISVDEPDPAKALANYRGKVGALKQKYGLATVPLTSRPVAEIFKMAVDRHPPFKEGKEDVGFRDAAIFLSVVDDLVAARGETGALVARDNAFHDPKIIEFATRAGVELQVFHSVGAMFDSLLTEAAAYGREQWNKSAAQAQRNLESRLPEIARFISEVLDIPEWSLVPGSRVVTVSRIEALKILDVRVPIPLEVKGLERIRLSFDVQVKFHAKIERMEMPQARHLKVGPEMSPEKMLSISEVLAALPQRSLAQPIFDIQADEIEVDRLVRVEANSDPAFEAFKFESASLVTEGLGGMAAGL